MRPSDADWNKLQDLVKRWRKDPLMDVQAIAIAVAQTGILPPSREQGTRIFVPSFTERDREYIIVGDRCNCAASYGRRPAICSHPHYHTACMRGHHPATRVDLRDVIHAPRRDSTGLFGAE